jgi:hypothetical protein
MTASVMIVLRIARGGCLRIRVGRRLRAAMRCLDRQYGQMRCRSSATGQPRRCGNARQRSRHLDEPIGAARGCSQQASRNGADLSAAETAACSLMYEPRLCQERVKMAVDPLIAHSTGSPCSCGSGSGRGAIVGFLSGGHRAMRTARRHSGPSTSAETASGVAIEPPGSAAGESGRRSILRSQPVRSVVSMVSPSGRVSAWAPDTGLRAERARRCWAG